MRYFWAEDFNEGKEDAGKLEEKLRLYFDLPIDKTVNKKDLKSMLQYLEEKKNFRKIDAFILDIRFPVSESETEKIKDEIYEHFYQKFITRDMYDNNIEDAPGLLLYLILVFRYHIPLEKIVFISAHISDDNVMFQHLNNMKEFMYKKLFTDLTESDVYNYRGCANHLIDPMRKDGIFKDRSDVEWMESSNPNVDDVVARLDQLILDHPKYFEIQRENDGTLQQYKQLKMQFNDMGLSMPLAFEKPKPNGIEIDKKYSFLHWEKMADSKQYNAIRSSIQEMSLILIEKMNNKLYKDFKKLLTCEEYELETYDDIFFNRYLEQVMDLLPLECGSDESALSSIVVKEIASVWENTSLPKYSTSTIFNKRSGKKQKGDYNKWYYHHEDSCFYANHSAMKIVRNWSGHQGINNVGVLDLGFIFTICMRGVFDIDELGDKKEEYLKHERKIFSLFEQAEDISADLSQSLSYFIELNNETWKNGRSDDIYERISGLGNTGSKIRLDVSMDEIYMLYFHTISKGLTDNDNRAQKKAYKNGYEDICEYIKSRTWNNWKERYNKRFRQYYWVR